MKIINNEYLKLKEILNDKNIYAHKTSNNVFEKLIDHCDLTYKYLCEFIRVNKLENLIKNIIDNIDSKNSTYIYDMFINAATFHDLGKSNPTFQYNKMNNLTSSYIRESKYNANHSLLSSFLYNNFYINEISNSNFNRKDKKKLTKLNFLFSYIISRHHSELNDNFSDYLTELEKFKDNIINDNYYISLLNDIEINNTIIYDIDFKDLSNNEYDIFFLLKLLYSLLISADYYSTYSFMNNEELSVYKGFNDELKNRFISEFEKDNIVKNTRNKIYTKEIDKLRQEIFLETEKNVRMNLNKDIFFLEAPTGSGKTYTSINLMLNLLKENKNINKVFYVFPFNTLSEQTHNSLINIFPELQKDICKINSISPILENENNYNLDYLNNLFINYPLNIISHVKLFNMLFGINKNNNYTFQSMANSIIILDEIQVYNINIWKEMINIFDYLSSTFNIKFIIMSATLPSLEILSNSNEYVDLLPNKHKYYNNPLFKNRVNLNFDLVNKNIDLDKLIEKVTDNLDRNKLLIEFQDKKNCREFYNLLKSKTNITHSIYEITGDDNLIYRNNVLKKVKEKDSKVILCSTQVCEAGVDIDMDIGFKEISVLESEEQFLGRINRSCLKDDCRAYFFTLKGSKIKFILKEDIRISFGLKNKDIQNCLIEKDFKSYYEKMLKEMNLKRSKMDEDNFIFFLKKIKENMFKTIFNDMKLINDNNDIFFIPHTKFKDVDGYEVWREYEELLNDKTLKFSEKKIKLSKLNEKINLFTFSVFRKDNKEISISNGIKHFGNYYYIENGDNYVSNEGKVERDKLKELIEYIDIISS